MNSILVDDKLFVKSGITVLSALAGTGKTTYMIKVCDKFKSNGYEVCYFNADLAVVKDSYLLPDTYDDFLSTLADADEKDIVIIDSLKMFCAKYDFDVMDNNSMMRLFMDLRSITSKTKCSIILVHHSFKEKKLKTAEEHLFGSRAIEEQCDSAFFYNTSLDMRIVKNRLGLIRDTTYTFKAIGV